MAKQRAGAKSLKQNGSALRRSAKPKPARTLGTASQIAQKLVGVGPADPAGKLFRRYWLPIDVAADLGDKPKEVRILGEDLVLFRFPGGKPGLVGQKCAHRNTSLVLGAVEKAGIRCAYHGWLYDANGQCIDQPADPAASRFCKEIKIAGYPCEDRYGIIWAYMGEGKPPLIPPYDIFVRKDGYNRTVKSYHKCNWLQVTENMVDPQHTSFLHRFSPLTDVVAECPTLDKVEDTQYGFVVQSTRMDQGHSRLDHFVMPAMNRVAVNHIHPPLEICWFVTPIDDTHAISVTYRFVPDPPGADQAAIQKRIDMVEEFDRKIPRATPHESGSVVFAQDMWAMEAQGPISDRTREHLASSDKGVIRLRRGYWEAIKAIDAGKDPPNVWRDPKVERLDFQTGIFHRGVENFDPKRTNLERAARTGATAEA
ncbi:MAG TPA: aromatic ring-hydroxylating dioxygenase subunit alpha [Stellaceae bacterium]|nr:aromatic ring-hydroxylating dioxygenase subunit alpha [Stellaceae bacterium]